MKRIAAYLPIVDWLKGYRGDTLLSDGLATWDDSGSKTVERTMERCEKVLTDLGFDINRLKEQVADVEAI
ncbi:hypothetical protein [Idiomarina sp.]|uniref:hypothetical protein n=1 Tax=Idiomarina sp. TaxID=1874361 RepID=UPI0025C237EF|nr:hypothetical protein [Idiomarina sp.]